MVVCAIHTLVGNHTDYTAIENYCRNQCESEVELSDNKPATIRDI
jgi:hypothetical protein